MVLFEGRRGRRGRRRKDNNDLKKKVQSYQDKEGEYDFFRKKDV